MCRSGREGQTELPFSGEWLEVLLSQCVTVSVKESSEAVERYIPTPADFEDRLPHGARRDASFRSRLGRKALKLSSEFRRQVRQRVNNGRVELVRKKAAAAISPLTLPDYQKSCLFDALWQMCGAPGQMCGAPVQMCGAPGQMCGALRGVAGSPTEDFLGRRDRRSRNRRPRQPPRVEQRRFDRLETQLPGWGRVSGY